MTVVVVPPGTLEPNPHNPHYNKTAKERWKSITRVLSQALAKIPTVSETPVAEEYVEEHILEEESVLQHA